MHQQGSFIPIKLQTLTEDAEVSTQLPIALSGIPNKNGFALAPLVGLVYRAGRGAWFRTMHEPTVRPDGITFIRLRRERLSMLLGESLDLLENNPQG